MTGVPTPLEPAAALAVLLAVPGVVAVYPEGRIARLRRAFDGDSDGTDGSEDLVAVDRRSDRVRVRASIGVAAASSAAEVAAAAADALRRAAGDDSSIEVRIRVSRVVD